MVRASISSSPVRDGSGSIFFTGPNHVTAMVRKLLSESTTKLQYQNYMELTWNTATLRCAYFPRKHTTWHLRIPSSIALSNLSCTNAEVYLKKEAFVGKLKLTPVVTVLRNFSTPFLKQYKTRPSFKSEIIVYDDSSCFQDSL